MPQFDHSKMASLISEFRKSVQRLKTLSSLPKNDFLNDPDKIGSAKYHFIVAIESCIDMGNHIIARNGYRLPDDYADTFQSLAEAGAIDERFALELKNMAKFRNRLVHLYWEVDNETVYDILQKRLSDFKRFIDSLSVFLNFDEK